MGAPSESHPGDRDDGQPGQRVLEKVLHGAVVEQVLRLDVDPQGSGDARPRSGVDEQLGGEERGVELVARHGRRRVRLGERLEPEQTATDLLSEAEELARRGELRAAIRKAYIALLVELGDRKFISLAQHKTNRDYLNALRSVPQLHSRMRGLTDSFERHWYGFANATENDWQEFRTGYLAARQIESN